MNEAIANVLSAHADYLGLNERSSKLVCYRALAIKRLVYVRAVADAVRLQVDSSDEFWLAFRNLMIAETVFENADCHCQLAASRAEISSTVERTRVLGSVGETCAAAATAFVRLLEARRHLGAIAPPVNAPPALSAFLEWNRLMSGNPVAA